MTANRSPLTCASDVKVLDPSAAGRGFWSLFVTQFQGALSDNIFKFLVVFLITSTRPPAERDQLLAVAGLVFALPFILFSMTGGFLADRFSKRSVIVGTKVAEVGIMVLGLVGLWLAHVPFLMGVLFLMAAQSAFFGPAKYGILPELLSEKRLSWGNGWVGFGTFVAIVTGGVVAGLFHEWLGDQRYLVGLLLVLLSGIGLTTSLGISRVPPADPTKKFRLNFLSEVWINLQKARGDRVLMLAIAGSFYFWFIAALFGEPTILIYSQDVLNLTETQIAMLRACLAIGIGVGSAVAGIVSGRKIEYGLVPMGAFGLAFCAALLGGWKRSPAEAAVILGMLGFSGGFYIVPIMALVQHRPLPAEKGSMIAANAWLTWIGVFLASGVFWLLRTKLRMESTTIFLLGSLVTFLGTIYAVKLVPDSLLRFVLWALTRTIYRIRVLGRDNIPERGGALFVCNHVSFVDALLLIASTDRKVRFLMLKQHYELPYIRPFARILGIIPISSEQRPREMIQSLKAAAEAIRLGDAVCIFAEGQITRLGRLLPFRRGFERIMKDAQAPIIPVALDGVWGSIFSFEQGRFLWKLPRRLPYAITVNYGKPLPHTTTPFEVRQKVEELSAEAWRVRRGSMKPLHRSFVRMARLHPFRFAMADGQNPRLSFGSVLARTVFLGRRLKKVWAGQQMVGILLPPCVPAALANHVAMLMGKVPVNLNYTVSDETLASCVQQCGIRTVLTSRGFLEKIKVKVPGEAVYLEDVARAPSLLEKLAAFLMAHFVPVELLERALGRGKKVQLDDLATIIFSSGSTGEPKGVMLSHYNLGSNIEQMEQVFGLNRRDSVLGVLPFFHSFGFTGTLCMPSVLGVGAIYHPNPLDAKAIGPLVREYKITFVLATPTFLQLYMRACTPGDFGSVRVVMTGAEKLPDRVAIAFDEQFGIRPLEGYGCTECSPAVAVNTHDFRSAGFRQIGAKRGKIGHPLPGVSVRIVNPETMEPAPLGQPGLMLVRGPNVMQGYLGKPDKTAEVLIDGPGSTAESGSDYPMKWYVTGDIAAIDEDGFLQITDRLSRFSKIGGEMVPHIKIEEKLHELAGAMEQTFVVTGLPDEKKGERLIVLHKLADEPLQACLEKLSESDLPNLWKPRAEQFIRVEAFPYLGTGKLDLRKVRDLAAELGQPRTDTK